MAKVTISPYLAIICGVLFTGTIHAQVPRTIPEAFDIIRGALHDQKNGRDHLQLTSFIGEDGVSLPDNNIWTALSLDQTEWNVSKSCLNDTKSILGGLATGQMWALKSKSMYYLMFVVAAAVFW